MIREKPSTMFSAWPRLHQGSSAGRSRRRSCGLSILFSSFVVRSVLFQRFCLVAAGLFRLSFGPAFRCRPGRQSRCAGRYFPSLYTWTYKPTISRLQRQHLIFWLAIAVHLLQHVMDAEFKLFLVSQSGDIQSFGNGPDEQQVEFVHFLFCLSRFGKQRVPALPGYPYRSLLLRLSRQV